MIFLKWCCKCLLFSDETVRIELVQLSPPGETVCFSHVIVNSLFTTVFGKWCYTMLFISCVTAVCLCLQRGTLLPSLRKMLDVSCSRSPDLFPHSQEWIERFWWLEHLTFQYVHYLDSCCPLSACSSKCIVSIYVEPVYITFILTFNEATRWKYFVRPQVLPSVQGKCKWLGVSLVSFSQGIAPRLEFSTKTTITECSADADINIYPNVPMVKITFSSQCLHIVYVIINSIYVPWYINKSSDKIEQNQGLIKVQKVHWITCW